MRKILTLVILMLPLAASAQFGEGPKPPGGMPGGRPAGDRPPEGGFNPHDMIDTLKSHAHVISDSLLAAADVINRKAEIIYAVMRPAVPLPAVSTPWAAAGEGLRLVKSTNPADSIYDSYLCNLERCQASLDSTWTNEEQRLAITDGCKVLKDSLSEIKDSIRSAADKSEAALKKLEQLLGHAKEMQSRFISAPEQVPAGVLPKEMIYSLQAVITDMEREKRLAERQSSLARGLQAKLEEIH